MVMPPPLQATKGSLTSDATARKPYGFQWGDRIDHPNFGMGTVIGEPVAVAGAETSPRCASEDRGRRVPVEWDDPGRTAGSAAVIRSSLLSVPRQRRVACF